MYVLNFKKQFVPAIESGAKKQAIRKDKRQPKVGDILRLYTGKRTKRCRRIADVVCTEVYPLKIHDSGITTYIPTIDNFKSLSKFAELDGFNFWEEMRDWFKKIY